MTELKTIKALIKATRQNKSVTICPEYLDEDPINIPLSECNVDISVTVQVKNITVQFTTVDIKTKEKYVSKSLDNNLPDSIKVLYLVTIRFSYESGFEGYHLVLGNIWIGKLKEISKRRYSIHVFDVVEINKKAYF